MSSNNETDLVDMKITREIRDKLKNLGRKGETYDTIIRRLLEASKNG